MEIEIYVTIPANNGGRFQLNGAGASDALHLGFIDIPTSASARTGIIRHSISKDGNAATASYAMSFEHTAGRNTKVDVGRSVADATIRASVEDDILFRLYWTSLTADPVTFRNMRTWVTA